MCLTVTLEHSRETWVVILNDGDTLTILRDQEVALLPLGNHDDNLQVVLKTNKEVENLNV